MMNRLLNPHSLSRRLPVALAAALVCGMVLAPGCEKKKPPPPPPPPVEAPPPPEVSFDSIMQTLKSDPRVEAVGNLGITDDSFARAAVRLADAFARGNADALKDMVTNRAKAVVESMENDGTWATLTPRIEKVRIVYAGVRSAVGEIERAQGIAQMKAMQPGQMKAFEDVLIKRGLDANEIARFKAEYQLELDRNLINAQNDSGKHESDEGGSADINSDSPPMALLIAVQTPDGAELLGWSARKTGGEGSGSWVFSNASTLSSLRAKASDWDGVGMFGFSLGTGKAPVAAPTPKPAETAPGNSNGGGLTPAGGGAGGGNTPPTALPPRDPRKLVPGNN